MRFRVKYLECTRRYLVELAHGEDGFDSGFGGRSVRLSIHALDVAKLIYFGTFSSVPITAYNEAYNKPDSWAEVTI